MKKIIFEMTIILAVSIGIALIFNYSREDGIPFTPEDKVKLIISDDVLFNAIETKSDSTLANENINVDSATAINTNTSSKQADSTLKAIQNSTKQQRNEEYAVEFIRKNTKKSRKSEFFVVTYEQMKEIIVHQNRFVIIDARRPEQYNKSHIPSSINIFPLDEEAVIIEKILSLPKNKIIIIYCDGGNCELSDEIATLLENFGFQNFCIYEGGWEEWIHNQQNN